ncbi:hypothetical protein BSZ22_12820 [Bradyrhizobium canariense]|uniref:Uncharacterized protein n=1 Tax=Bradyrhizobium canariense TaxID=255045 RepID=A0A1X3FXA2_9BRAD|nr:hypothetical protein BSZ22_12820 [Bradyrhizobium canariense]OSI79598.1 hypothetical protein BSZ23_14510 [Bradyrhizobium canariense]OSI91282.1 hypothetical protein BSZ24_18305 [Bradyrhizobium canariense]OSI91906.1 hypothetical protein BSZ25_14155 [Bradyrhizobium canariense]OSJ05715.1 hypothetical protein BSZ16_11930 [Bradyrhizobium canariense]
MSQLRWFTHRRDLKLIGVRGGNGAAAITRRFDAKAIFRARTLQTDDDKTGRSEDALRVAGE